MRIRRTILAPAILALGTTGAVVVGPVVALATAAAPTSAAVAVTVRPNVVVMHG
jgi:hypothetical protein